MLKLSSRTLMGAAAALCCASILALPASAADTTTEAIIVTGQTPERLQQFVDRVSVASPMADQLPRWDTSICTSLAGLPRRQAEFVADRIAQRAMAVGVQPGEPGCQANVSVIFTANSDDVARRMFEQDRQMFAYYQETNVSTLGQAAFNSTFLRSNAPVRWWHVSHTVTADGISLAGDSSTGGMSNAPVQRASGTRLRSETREDLRRAIIIVDAQRVGSVQLAALADYISMVALAQVDPNANTSAFPSILNLFAQNGEPVTELTEWDLAYLDGLYKTTRNAASAQAQEREIARRMSGAQTP